MITNTSYYLNKATFIPSAVAQPSIGSNTPTNVAQLQSENDFREKEVLVYALGYNQTTELLDQFETTPPYDFKDSALQKWKDLVDGKTYGNKRWNGLRYEVGGKKVSLIAFYTFFYYLKEDFSTYSTTGVQVANSENATNQIPNQKQANAWNSFVKMYCGDYWGNGLNYSFFTNWNGTALQWAGNQTTNEVSLYTFLADHPEDYDLSFFNHFTVINSMNL